MKVSASSLRKGNVVDMEGRLYVVLTVENIHPGKGTPVTQLDMRRISDGVKVSERWRTTETVERAFVDDRDYTFLYEDGDGFHEQRDEMRARAERERFSVLSTHPATKARIARAHELAAPGLYTDDAPARDLFGDFEAACLKATRGQYLAALGPFVEHIKLRPVGDAFAASEKDSARAAILPRYLGYEPPTWRPLFPNLSRIPDVQEPKPLAQRLRAARSTLRQQAGAARVQVEKYRKASEESFKWERVRTIMDAGLAVDFDALGLKAASRIGVSERIDTLMFEAAEAAGVIDEAGETAMVRLAASLCLLGVRGIEQAIPDAPTLRRRADALLPVMGGLHRMLPSARTVRQIVAAADMTEAGVTSKKSLDAAKGLMRQLTEDIRARLDEARRIGGAVPDPFAAAAPENAPDRGTVASDSHALAYTRHNLGESLVGASGSLFVERWSEMYRRVLGELVEIGEKIERGLAAAKAEAPAPS